MQYLPQPTGYNSYGIPGLGLTDPAEAFHWNNGMPNPDRADSRDTTLHEYADI